MNMVGIDWGLAKVDLWWVARVSWLLCIRKDVRCLRDAEICLLRLSRRRRGLSDEGEHVCSVLAGLFQVQMRVELSRLGPRYNCLRIGCMFGRS